MTIATTSHPSHLTRPVRSLADQIVAAMPELRRSAVHLSADRHLHLGPDDLVQETVLTALRNAHAFEGGNPGGWLYTILLGHVRNSRRRALRRANTVSLTLASDDGREDTLDAPVAATQQSTVECADLLRVLATLPEAEQHLIRLAHIEGFSYLEIVDLLGIPLGTVQSRLFRALKHLRAAYLREPERQHAAGAVTVPARPAALHQLA